MNVWSWSWGESFKCSMVVKCTLYIQKGRTALCIASWDGHDNIVELLLRRKADVNHQTVVRFQLAWPSVGNIIIPELHTSTSLFRKVWLRWWLHLNKDTFILWACSWTMAHMSIYKIRYPQISCNCACVHIYLYGAVIQRSYFIMQEGVSALMVACNEGQTAIVQLLLDNNANINLQTMVCLLNSVCMTLLFTEPANTQIFLLVF